MTNDEADDLAKRIINAFRGGPPLAEWRDVLAKLDAGRAGTAFVRLRGQLDHAPSIARFMAEYRALDTNDASTRQHCDTCGGSGWAPAPDRIVNAGAPHQHAYSQVKPCVCDEGRARAESTVWRNRTVA